MDFPVALQLAGRRALVVGGGAVAERRVRSLLAAGAHLTVVAPDLAPGLRALDGGFVHVAQVFAPAHVGETRLVFAATDDRDVNRRVAEVARAAGAWVNVADDPVACDFSMPAVARAGAVTIAVSTGGSSPALAGRLRSRIADRVLVPAHGAAAALLERVRRTLDRSGAAADVNAEAFRRALDAGLVEAVAWRDPAAIDRALAAGFGAGATCRALGYDPAAPFPQVEEGA